MKELCKQYKTQILLIAYGILSMPVFFASMKNGIDESWAYALNRLTSLNNIKFGKDIVFTYGPLGFLSNPMYINGNIVLATFIYIAMWASTMVLFYKLLKKNNNVYVILLSLFMMFLGSPAHGSDVYIRYCVLIALAVLWTDMSDTFATVFLTIATTIGFFFKFSVAVAVIGAFFMFFIAKMIAKEYKRIWILFLPCITIPISYLIYNPSFHGFLQFVKGSWEVSKGFNTAMSTGSNDPYVFLMFLLMFIYIAIMISQLIYRKQNNFFMMLWLSPCFFMSYKHGYVRADGHVTGACVEILATFSIALLLFDIEGLYEEVVKKTKKGMVQAGLIVSLFLVELLNYNTGLHPWVKLASRFQNISLALYQMTEDGYEKNLSSVTAIPNGILEVIRGASYTSYPWEITFIAPTGDVANDFIPLPVFQMYSAYTPYLDNKNANLFKGENAPEYIIFKFSTIDGRIPLLEAPSTWKAIQDNYEINMFDSENDYYLLQHKKNTTDRSGSTEIVQVDKSDIITVEGYSEAKIYANLTVWGKLVNVIWKIPEVKMRITYTDGTVKEGRVLMDNLSNGMTVNGLPYDHDTLYNALLSDGVNCRIQNISFSGNGLKYYADTLSVEYIQYNKTVDEDISYLQSADIGLTNLTRGDDEDVNIDIETLENNPILKLKGWAYVSDDNNDYQIYVKYNNQYYVCSKSDRLDIVKKFGLSGATNVGFSIKLPITYDGDIELIIVTDSKYYDVVYSIGGERK